MPKNHLFSVAIPFLPGRDGDFRIFAGCTLGKPRNQFSNFFFTLGTDKSKSVSPQLRYLEELKKYRPDILDACEKAMSAVDPDLDFIRVDEEAFLACPEESVDYAVMERTADAVVVPMDAGWSDVGSWSSLWEISAHTAEGNVCHGDVINHKTENSYVYAESGLV